MAAHFNSVGKSNQALVKTGNSRKREDPVEFNHDEVGLNNLNLAVDRNIASSLSIVSLPPGEE